MRFLQTYFQFSTPPDKSSVEGPKSKADQLNMCVTARVILIPQSREKNLCSSSLDAKRKRQLQRSFARPKARRAQDDSATAGRNQDDTLRVLHASQPLTQPKVECTTVTGGSMGPLVPLGGRRYDNRDPSVPRRSIDLWRQAHRPGSDRAAFQSLEGKFG